MSNNISEILNSLKSKMTDWNYPIEEPITDQYIESITKRKSTSSLSPILEKLGDEVFILFVNHPDYVTFLETMDGFEFDGLILFREGANKQVISSQADSLIKISRIWADFFPANTSNQPI